ncbi:MAG: uracil-xanthine permease [Clostridia bacterium]|nr:uracil-xanthine permease [Clostridia bacterium]
MSEKAIRDARTLGTPKMLLLGFQHMFAMFGATVLVPLLTGLSMSATLLFAGLGTLLFHFLTKRKVPAFLGSSFAFLGGYASITTWKVLQTGEDGVEALVDVLHADMLPYACVGVFCAGLVYLVVAYLIKLFGANKVMRFFPPIVTGPIIICIGLTLASSAINNCRANWWIALLAIAIVVVCNIFGKGMIKIIPILLGVVGSYIIAAIFGQLEPDKLQALNEAAWIGFPFQIKDTIFSLFTSPATVEYGDQILSKGKMIGTAIASIMPIALATMVEHIGDISAISSTVGENFIQDPGLHRTMLGDGLATSLAALFGAPANTTYGENTGVLALTKVYDPKVIRIAAVCAIVFSFCPKFAALIYAMPTATIGGVSLILYGMISAVGVRNVVENQVDFSKSRNVIIAALIMGLAIGINYSGAIDLGFCQLSGLAVAAIVGILLNAILPGNDYQFGKNPQGDEAVNFKV